MKYKNISELKGKIITIAEDDIAVAKNLVQVKGHKDFLARAHRQKALFTILLLKELELISSRRFQAMAENLDKDFKEQKRKEQGEINNYERIKNMTLEEMAKEIKLIANWDRKEVEKANKVNFYEMYLQKDSAKEDTNQELEIEMLEYGDTVELVNGDMYVYIRKELDTTGGLITQELNLVNIFTGEERNINEYRDDLTHDTDPNLSIKRFAN